MKRWKSHVLEAFSHKQDHCVLLNHEEDNGELLSELLDILIPNNQTNIDVK